MFANFSSVCKGQLTSMTEVVLIGFFTLVGSNVGPSWWFFLTRVFSAPVECPKMIVIYKDEWGYMMIYIKETASSKVSFYTSASIRGMLYNLLSLALLVVFTKNCLKLTNMVKFAGQNIKTWKEDRWLSRRSRWD